ncbi:MAG TPA: hypothetical protein VHN77_08260 [Phycisphaerales bacterium]|nr:hypothetical protein [Phycisphaerales bacterium]
MNLVFCMAGLYQRFRSAGYATPKFLLPFRGKTTLEHVVGEIVLSPGGRGQFGCIVFVANERDRAFSADIQRVLGSLALGSRGIKTHVAWVPDTKGQAHTASIGVDELEDAMGIPSLSGPVLFHNIDTIIRGRDFHAIRIAFDSGADGYIDCIDSDAPQYSYVATSSEPGMQSVAVEIREKVVISRNATTGLYGFRSAADYRAWAKDVDYAKEFYISDVYRAMLRQGRRIVINTSHAGHDTIIVGTPAEYEALASPAEVAAAKTLPLGVTP